MKSEIIVCGVGGQGVVSIAQTIATAGMSAGQYIRQSEVHGMAQRGASVVSHVRIADSEVYGDVIPLGHADMLVSMEPLETQRYIPYLTPDARVFVSAKPVETAFNYPDADSLKARLDTIPNCWVIDLVPLARKIGSQRSVNMIMMGVISSFLPFSIDVLESAIQTMFSGKRQKVLDMSLKAFRLGGETRLEL